MASARDIANLALGHIGERADVASLSPPEATTRAEKCAQFYPVARDALLEAHAWSFNTRRRTLAAVTNELNSWAYAYSLPSKCIRPLSVQLPEAIDDSNEQPFALETDDDGNLILFTNVDDANIRFQVAVTDTSKFTPLFVTALAWLLASYIAGPLIKGKAGVAVAKYAFERFVAEFAKATASNANASKDDAYEKFKPTWITDR